MQKWMWLLPAIALWNVMPAAQAQLVPGYGPRPVGQYGPSVFGRYDPLAPQLPGVPGLPGGYNPLHPSPFTGPSLSDPAFDRLLLLGHEDQAHAAFADLCQQLVRADGEAGTLADRLIDRSEGRCGRGFEKAAGSRIQLQKAFDTPAQFHIPCANFGKVSVPFLGRQLAHGRHENLTRFFDVGIHDPTVL